ncbi:flavin-dependent tryptophan halogenase PrnA [alpha proteobacterium Q-1]|uniref:tryptophan halogenase family protein n=1 Tax=Iodidimonas nitroreducens TaxID=1236968 RepID=UPI00049FCB1D|nr:tryptophan halogenase family protein [Iodidimonas nitroreducens]GAK32969.1 flavin-dependent tryptophan halogenase PrnA [alpha proteobacterium Q-1]
MNSSDRPAPPPHHHPGTDHAIRTIAIIGGGTAGWMAAAVLAKALGQQIRIRLVESDAIGTIGVGEATIPQIRNLNHYLGLDEHEMIRQTKGSFKLGIEFSDWGRIGDRYMHAFGDIGQSLGLSPFHHYWLRATQSGHPHSLWAYSLNQQAAIQNRFGPLERLGDSRLTGLRYAFHLDAGLYAAMLRSYSEARGVERLEGRVVDVKQHSGDGFIQSVLLENGTEIEADLFIDCSGFRGLLIEDALKTGYEDWSHWLPCNRAAAVPSETPTDASGKPLMRPYTQSMARPAGWQWRIPLQHRVGNGHVYCSAHLSDDEACALLLANLEGPALTEPRLLQFKTGRRKKAWNRNCVALGLAGGFMEPLESTSIHMIQTGISRLVSMFPDKNCDPALAAHYNEATRFEYERIRDFLILHYKATQRQDTAFWRACAEMPIPQSLQQKIELFEASARLYREADELFTEIGWLQVLLGQSITPRAYHPLADAISDAQLAEFLDHIRLLINRGVASLPNHHSFISRISANFN